MTAQPEVRELRSETKNRDSCFLHSGGQGSSWLGPEEAWLRP